ncbi:glycosyltransferase involved in cell wall biosynthesis [Labrenzia sp. EL_126]|nr:glycosyltransferase involved in cell wall biosynthesis [Labrenzia sp. EL_126]
MKVLQYPDFTNSNPYQTLMYDALRHQGCEVVSFNASPRTLLKRLLTDPSNILHLHWISTHIVKPGKLRVSVSMVIFGTALVIWRLRRKKIVWTLHNLVNHEQQNASLDRLNSQIVARLADVILLHGESARTAAKEVLIVSENKFTVVPHGNYDGIITYHPIREPQTDFSQRGMRFLFVGSIKPYKGVPDLINTFKELAGPHQLRIVGHAADTDLRQMIKDSAEKDNRIACLLKFVTDSELEEHLAWADVVVMPYRDIFTSGSLVLALTAGRPIVAPNIGLIQDYVDEQCAFLYDPMEVDGLANALSKAARMSDHKESSRAAKKAADKLKWDFIGDQLVSIYEKLMARRSQ